MERLFITKAENMGNLTVCLTFSDNTVQTVDIGEIWLYRDQLRENIARRAARWLATH
jgi:hypothetical protein